MKIPLLPYRFLNLVCGICILVAADLSSVQAETYPNRPVKVIVPYPAGGIVDISTRIITEKIAQDWKQSIVVENRPGANGNIGAAAVRSAPADGYTLLVAANFLSTNPLMDGKAKVSASDFTPIATLAMPPNLFVVPAASPARTLKDFVALARLQPGAINAANPGVGSSNHLGTELFEALAGIQFTQIGYKGQPPFIPDLLNGQLDFALASAGLVGAQIRSGKLRPLAVNYTKRLKNYPNVPTIGEHGYPDAVVLPWIGFVAPLGTPHSILEQWVAALKKAFREPDVIQRYENMEAENPGFFLEEFAQFLRAEDVRWRRIIAERHLNTH
ncbi:MAG: tripartite tricarboxylate transporter substrate binding protein [Zoogloeaceae bacterium]|jgi:tripartite-type tricarboxylate transporter receptor subunit TctC|nr:tripartite tricarboxylate transporter substrate binding protein [Zoogloeaceae bacterium]